MRQESGAMVLKARAEVYAAGGEDPVGTVVGADYDPLTGQLLRLRVCVPGSESPLVLPAALVDQTSDTVVLSVTSSQLSATPTPADAPRPLWYRAAGTLEPLRPVFGWVVRNRTTIKAAAGLMAILGAAASAALLLQTILGRKRSR